jgi:hypothetical protein
MSHKREIKKIHCIRFTDPEWFALRMAAAIGETRPAPLVRKSVEEKCNTIFKRRKHARRK